jgi:hypothetical protein
MEEKSRDSEVVKQESHKLQSRVRFSVPQPILEYMGRYTVKDADSAVTRIAHARPGSIPGRPTSLTLIE